MTVLTKSIILDFINGDHQAFTQIYKSYYADIRSYCYKHTRCSATADELTSDVFLRFWEARAQLDPERELKPYLFTITKNVTFTWLRRTLTDQRMKDEFKGRYTSGQQEVSSEVKIAAAMDLALLRKMMGKMPVKRKQTFDLCKIDGFSYAEAASILSISKETIKEHMSLAKKDMNKLANSTDFF